MNLLEYFVFGFSISIIFWNAYSLWKRFRPLTLEEKKILTSFNIALKHGAFVKVEYTSWYSKNAEYRVNILTNEIVVSDRLGALLDKIYCKFLDEKQKIFHTEYIEKIYSEVIETYPSTQQCIESPVPFRRNGVLKANGPPKTPRPGAHQSPMPSKKD